jgi:hypothetical protein
MGMVGRNCALAEERMARKGEQSGIIKGGADVLSAALENAI